MGVLRVEGCVSVEDRGVWECWRLSGVEVTLLQNSTLEYTLVNFMGNSGFLHFPCIIKIPPTYAQSTHTHTCTHTHKYMHIYMN